MVSLVADWVRVPDNNPAVLPDGTVVQLTIAGVRGTLDPAQVEPWQPLAYVQLNPDTRVWEHWDDNADEYSEFVAGWEAAAEAMQRQQTAAKLTMFRNTGLVFLIAWALSGVTEWQLGRVDAASVYLVFVGLASSLALYAGVKLWRLRKDWRRG